MTLSRTIPALPVVNIEESVAFYGQRLGFKAAYADDTFAVLVRDGAELHLWAARDESWKARSNRQPPVISGAETFIAGTASCRIESDDLESLYAEFKEQRVLHNEATVIEQRPWGEKDFAVLDHHRNLLTFYMPVDPNSARTADSG